MGLQAVCVDDRVVITDDTTGKILRSLSVDDPKCGPRETVLKYRPGDYIEPSAYWFPTPDPVVLSPVEKENLVKNYQARSEDNAKRYSDFISNLAADLDLHQSFWSLKHNALLSWNGYIERTIREIDEDFKSFETQWKTTARYTACLKQLDVVKKSGIVVENIVALGLGSHHIYPEMTTLATERTATGMKLAALITIRRALGGAGSMIPCVIQDPLYSNRSLDFEPVNDPDAYAHVNANTLVYNMAGFTFTWWHVSKGTWPVVMIDDRNESSQDPNIVIQDVQTMFENYACFPSIKRSRVPDLFLRRRLSKRDFLLRTTAVLVVANVVLFILYGSYSWMNRQTGRSGREEESGSII